MYAEMAGRRSLITEAIKKLVRHGILKVKNNQGYQYKITDYGLEISNGFHSTYAEEYRRVSRLSAKKYSCKMMRNCFKKFSIVLLQTKGVNVYVLHKVD